MTSNGVNVKSKTLALLSNSRFELSSLVDNNKPLALRECSGLPWVYVMLRCVSGFVVVLEWFVVVCLVCIVVGWLLVLNE